MQKLRRAKQAPLKNISAQKEAQREQGNRIIQIPIFKMKPKFPLEIRQKGKNEKRS